MPSEVELAGTAYSYIRFSSAEQERGDSLRRQKMLRDDWLKRHPQVSLDTNLSLQDLGVSAFRGRHRGDKHALGQFLDAVRRGRVERGSILLLENLDRLSREEEEEALEVLLGLLRSGVVVVQLEPETVFRKGDGMIGLFRAIMELSRGHRESKLKAVRVASAWRERQRLAAEGKGIVTTRCPAWLVAKGGKFEFKPGAKETIRRIFAASRAGHGSRSIARDLLADRVPHFCDGVWNHTYVRQLLVCRSVIGEMQPYRRADGKRVKDGPPVAGYFPAALTESEWHATQRGLAARRNEADEHKRGKSPGPRGHDGWVRLFNEVYDAPTGDKFMCVLRVSRDRHSREQRRYRVLQQEGVGRWGAKARSFPLADFEGAVIRKLEELDPADVLPPSREGSRVTELAGAVAKTEGLIAELQAALEAGTERPRAALDAMGNLEKKLAAQTAELRAAQREVASPAHEEWGTLKGLAKLVETDHEARVRVRAVLARRVDRVDCLVVPKADYRLMVAQVAFRDTAAARRYLLVHRIARWRKETKDGPSERRPAKTVCVDFAEAFEAGGVVDLRNPADVAEWERLLARVDPAKFFGAS